MELCEEEVEPFELEFQRGPFTRSYVKMIEIYMYKLSYYLGEMLFNLKGYLKRQVDKNNHSYLKL